MADQNQELQYEPESHFYSYGKPEPCGQCGGRGKIVLFVTPRACDKCGGSGRVRPAPCPVHVPAQFGYWRCARTYDKQGRVIVESRWFEPVAEADQAGK